MDLRITWELDLRNKVITVKDTQDQVIQNGLVKLDQGHHQPILTSV